jgi:hypothetical protein
LLDNNIASIREKINLRGGDIVRVCLNGDEIVKNYDEIIFYIESLRPYGNLTVKDCYSPFKLTHKTEIIDTFI